MTNTTNESPIYFRLTCRPWESEPRQVVRVSVDAEGAVRVWDLVAGHYTTCHRLSARTMRRIARRAAEVRGAV
jgi:hypothetical protein